MMHVMNTITIPSLNPGECTESYAEGWRKAEAALRNGAAANGEAPCALLDMEEFTGYADRMGVHTYLEEIAC